MRAREYLAAAGARLDGPSRGSHQPDRGGGPKHRPVLHVRGLPVVHRCSPGEPVRYNAPSRASGGLHFRNDWTRTWFPDQPTKILGSCILRRLLRVTPPFRQAHPADRTLLRATGESALRGIGALPFKRLGCVGDDGAGAATPACLDGDRRGGARDAAMGSACRRGRTRRSHVLTAVGVVFAVNRLTRSHDLRRSCDDKLC